MLVTVGIDGGVEGFSVWRFPGSSVSLFYLCLYFIWGGGVYMSRGQKASAVLLCHL